MRDFVFLPPPRSIRWTGDSCRPDAEMSVRIDAARRLQSYRIELRSDAIEVIAADDAAAFYARQTLAQIRRQSPRELPCGVIEDAPDFPVRGVMLDISRCKVPTLETLFMLIDELAEWKVNQLQLYTEHTFAYRAHEIVWRDASPLTADDLKQIDRYCRERFIDLVPNQNSFGHMERWLKHPPYRDLAECPDGAFYFDAHRPAATLNPLDPRSIELVRALHDELLPNFPHSKFFNVGCDETMELGMGRSRDVCERFGRERVYLDFVRKIHSHVSSHDRTMMLWGDIILHRPDLIAELPRPIIALDWGYEADHPFAVECEAFARSGIPHYVCPGTSSWCSIAGRTSNAIECIRSAATNGLKHGAIGLLNTDWGDWGHWQFLPISYVGLAMGAIAGWNVQGSESIDLARVLDTHVFHDTASAMGALAMSLGDVYRLEPRPRKNGTLLFWLLQVGSDRGKLLENASLEYFDAMESAIDSAIAPIDSARMQRADAALIVDEFKQAARMMQYACNVGRGNASNEEREAIVAEHRRLWIARNRPGGLEESLGRFRE